MDAEAAGPLGQRFAHTPRVPFGPFAAAGELLYQGPWVAERLAEFGGFLREHPDSVPPVIRDIMASGSRYTAVDVFTAEHRLGEVKAQVAVQWQDTDVLVLPALGTTFTTAQLLADPIATNTVLGYYTHFGNLLDLCAAVVPAGLTSDGRPAALMVLGPRLAEDRVLAVAAVLAADPVADSVAVTGSTDDDVTHTTGHGSSSRRLAATDAAD